MVRCNGWLREAEQLDALTGDLCELTRDVRAAGLELADRRPFADPLPAAD
jgi:hypothetical protein